MSQAPLKATRPILFNVRQREEFGDIISKIRQQSVELESICDVRDGIILGDIKICSCQTQEKIADMKNGLKAMKCLVTRLNGQDGIFVTIKHLSKKK